MHITAQPRPVSEMTYTVSSGTLNSTIPYHTVLQLHPCIRYAVVTSTIRLRFDGRSTEVIKLTVTYSTSVHADMLSQSR